MQTGLYIVGTPIGNLGDMSPRVEETLRTVDLIAAEDTRNSIKLLNHFDIHTPMTSYHEFNKLDKGETLIDKLKSGQNIAIITDAGTPGISDPGEELVARCFEEDIEVFAVPGAVAAVTAVTTSGQRCRRFAFEAFLPKQKKDRKRILDELKEETRTMITLWSIFRSPLMIGTDLPQLDEVNLQLLTNEEILAMNKNPYQAFQSSDSSNDNIVIWTNDSPDDLSYYECYFNISENPQTVKLNITVGPEDNIRDLWEHQNLGPSITFTLPPHSCKAFKITVTK